MLELGGGVCEPMSWRKELGGKNVNAGCYGKGSCDKSVG